ncbi:MAG: twin-arginine translocase subunit TatC [Verrucomicrobiota bacterium]
MRDKLSRKRNVLLEDEEKPFLEHLEDLRKMLMRMALTLVTAVTVCFVFNDWFFKVVQYPMARAGLASAMEKHRPEGIDMLAWSNIHKAARGASILEGNLRRHFLEQALPDPVLRPYAEAFLIYHATSLLPEEAQAGFMETAAKSLPADRSAGVLEAALAIRKAVPSPSLEELKPVIENVAMAPAETFMLSMKLSTFAGIIVSFPLLFYFLLEFILPGLNTKERKLLWPALTIGFGLFLVGVVFSYYFVIPNALEFFHEYSAELNVKDTWRIGMYISFVTTFCLIFGVSFELPVVVMILVKLDLLTSATMRRTRAWAIVIIVVAGAILTPTGDIFTLSLLSGPMIIMYETCIWLAVAREKRNAREEAEEQNRDMARRAALVGVASVQMAKPGSSMATPEEIYTQPALDYHDPHHGDGYDRSHDHGHDHDHHHGHSLGHDDYPRDEENLNDGRQHGYGDGSGAGNASAWENHPHHPDPEKPTAEEEQAQYMREHAHLFPSADTHPESIPVEERHPAGSDSPADSDAPTHSPAETSVAPEETPKPKSAEEDKPSGDQKSGDASENRDDPKPGSGSGDPDAKPQP